MLDPTNRSPTPSDASRTQSVPPLSETLPRWTTAPPEVLPGAVPGYEILEELGRGGMGVVYKARQLSLNRLVALKMILAADHAGPTDRERFRAEAEAVARLQHPNIVQVHEVGDHAGRPYFSQEFVAGGSLARKLGGTPLSAGDSARLVETLARAMAYAHQRGIVHRDLKPANVLLTEDGTPKVADFGLAKRLEAQSLASSTGVVGTPSYMAPEQASGQGREVGPAADVYALGAILYECLTGRPPFKAATPLDTLMQVAHDDPVSPSRLQRGTPRDLETICLKCLEKLPDKRYGSASELAEDLHHFQSGEPIAARPVGVLERANKWARRRPAVAGLMAGIVALTAAALGLLTLAWQDARAASGRAEQALQGEERQRIQAEVNQQKAEDALKTEEKLRREADEQRRKFQRLSVGLVLDRGVGLAEQGDPYRGLLWMTRGLQLVGKEDADLERTLRQNIAGWRTRIHPLRGVVSQPDSARGATFSPDRKLIVTWGTKAHRWDAATGKLRGELPHNTTINVAVFSGDGKRIATTGVDKKAIVWDTELGRQIGVPHAHGVDITFVALSHTGTLLATAGADYAARLWDVETGREIGAPLKHENAITSIAFRPDNKALLTTSTDRTARLWDVTGKPIGEPMKHNSVVNCAAFSPNGKLIATGSSDSTARLWDAATGAAVGQPMRHDGVVMAVAFTPNNSYLLTASSDKMARFWTVATCEPYRVPMPHAAEVYAVAPSPNGKLILTAGPDQTARLWDASSVGQAGGALPHQQTLREAVFAPDNKTVLTRCYSGIVRVWEATSFAPDPVPVATPLSPASPQAVALSPDGQMLAMGNTAGVAQVWKCGPRQAELVGKPIEHKPTLYALTFGRDGKTLLTGAYDKTARLWDAATGEPRGEPMAHDYAVNFVALSGDGNTALAGGGRRGILYDVGTGKRRGKPLNSPVAFACVAVSPDGSVALTGGHDGVVRFWDGATGEPIEKILSHRGIVNAMAFSADGKHLLTGSDDRTARLWDVATGKPATPPLAHAFGVRSVAISPDGKTLLTWSADARTQLWDAATGKPLGPAVVHSGPAVVAFGSEGKTYHVARSTSVLRDLKVPAPVEGDAERLALWAQVVTGLEMDEDGTIGVLDGPKWADRRDRLEKLGGPPAP